VAFGSINNGLHEFLARDAFADELAVFIHIPKTAGSSLSAELAQMRRPYHNIHRTYYHGETVTFSRLEDEIEAVIAGGKLAVARSCSGHFSWGQAQPIRTERPDARCFTFLRDPVERVISDYRYSRTPAHPTSLQTIERFPTIESYIAAPETQDKMAAFLMPGDVIAPADIEAFIASNYAFVGLLEMYLLSFNILSRLLGENRMPSEHRRVTEDTDDNWVDASPELHAAIARYNPRDVALYDIAHTKLTAIADQWRALCELEPPTARDG
jgi:hypothetical protein